MGLITPQLTTNVNDEQTGGDVVKTVCKLRIATSFLYNNVL